jgi:hypothetical protein
MENEGRKLIGPRRPSIVICKPRSLRGKRFGPLFWLRGTSHPLRLK